MPADQADLNKITLEELIRNFAQFRADTREDFAELRKALSTMRMIHPDVYEANRLADRERLAALERRMEDTEESRKFLTRAIAVQFVGAVLAVAVFLVQRGATV